MPTDHNKRHLQAALERSNRAIDGNRAKHARQLADAIREKASELGTLLRELRDSSGWKSLGYSSWAECCEAEFGYSKRHANRLIQSQQVIEQVGPVGPTSPNDRQARELARLPEDQRADCWADFTEECETRGDKPTAAGLREKVDVWAGDNEAVALASMIGEEVDAKADVATDNAPGELDGEGTVEPVDKLAAFRLVKQCSQEWDLGRDWRLACSAVAACINRVGREKVADALDELSELVRPTEPEPCDVCGKFYAMTDSDGKQSFCSHCLKAGKVLDHGTRMRRPDEWREFDSGPVIEQ